jgi:hypothetical protein
MGCGSSNKSRSLTTLGVTSFTPEQFDKYISFIKSRCSYNTKQGDISKVYISDRKTEEKEDVIQVLISTKHSLCASEITIRWNEGTPLNERILDIDTWIRHNVIVS